MGTRRFTRWAIGLAAFSVAHLSVGSASAETLEEALAKTYLNNPTLLASRAETRATDELVAQALSNWRPTLSATGQVSREWNETRFKSQATGSRTEEQTLTPRSASVDLSQPLYRGGRTVAATEQAEHLVRSQRATLTSVEQTVLLDTVTAYMDVVRDQAVLQLNINNEQVLQRQLQASRDRFEVGEITRTDVSQSESRLARATAQRIQAEGNLAASRAAYQRVVGDYPGTLQTPKPSLQLPASQEESVAGSANNPDVLASIFAERAAVEGTDVVFGELLPRLTLNASVSRSIDSQPDLEEDNASVSAQLVVPLYQAGDVSSRLRESKERVSQRRQQIIETRRSATNQAISAWEAWQTALAQIQSFEAQVRAANIALEGVRQEAQVGARTVLDVLDAEQEALDSQVSLVTAQRDEIVAEFQLLAAIGRLTAQNLALPVPYYNVEENYHEVRNKWYGWGPPIE